MGDGLGMDGRRKRRDEFVGRKEDVKGFFDELARRVFSCAVDASW